MLRDSGQWKRLSRSRISSWPAAIGAVVVCCLSTLGGAQDFISSSMYSADDLAAEVARLKESVKTLQDQAQEAKKKAAGKPTAELRGRVFVDTAFFSQDALDKSAAGVGEARNGFGFRAARIGVQGKGFDVIEYVIEVDFASPILDDEGDSPLTGNGVTFKDVWMAVTELPLIGTLRIGHFKEPFCLEEFTGNRNISFMERSMSHSLLVPSQKLGVAMLNRSEDERMTWAMGVFQTDLVSAPPLRNFDDLASQVAARVTYLPWYDEAGEGRGLLHTGVGYYYANAFHDVKRFSARPNSLFGPIVLDSGELAIRDWQAFNLELAWVYGPLSIQGEYFAAIVDPTAAGVADGHLQGFYVMTSYFLTGENRPYNRKNAAFDKVRPYENFFRVQTQEGYAATGMGAWEVVYRYDFADLYDVPAAGDNLLGQCTTHTLGMNWYLTPYARVMWNYIHAQPTRNHASAGNLDALTMRCQIDF